MDTPLPRTQERFSRLRIGGRERAAGGWGLEKIFVKIAFLFESFQAGAQIGDSIADAVEFFGVQLEGLTGEPKWPPRAAMILPTVEMRTNVMTNSKTPISGTLSAICGYCTDGVRRTSTMQDR